MKRLLTLCLLIAAFSAAGASPAKACPPIPGIQQVCELITGSSLLDAVRSRVQIYVETMLYTLKLESAKKYSQSVAVLEQKGARQAQLRQDEREHIPAVAGQSCVLHSAIASALTGGAKTVPSLSGPMPTPPSMRTEAQVTADAKAAAAPLPPLPPAVEPNGDPRPVGAALADKGRDTSAYDYSVFRNKLVEQQALNSQNRRQNNTPSSQDALMAVAFDANLRQSNYGPNQPKTQFRDADISAPTILLTETFPPDQNVPTPATFTVGKTEVTVAPRSMQDAANAYCSNLTDPTVLNPNRGEALKADSNRKAHAVERAGWDARASLASTICQEIVAIRAPKTLDPAAMQGLTKIALDYRTSACAAANNEITEADKKYLDCPAATADAKAVAASGAKFTSKYSEYEMMDVLYNRLMPSLLGAKLMGSAGGNDIQGNLLAVDQMALTLNFRIYEMQEKLNLIKAAQLAQLVENSKTGPGASAPSR